MKKYFTKNASTNIIILAISYLSFPLSLIFKKIGFSANFITFLSLIFGLVSIFFFLFVEIYILFIFFFYLSVILDFCDGQVARMTNSVNKTEFDLDINTDLVKNCIIFICIGLLYNNSIYWVQTCSLIFLYGFSKYSFACLDA